NRPAVGCIDWLGLCSFGESSEWLLLSSQADLSETIDLVAFMIFQQPFPAVGSFVVGEGSMECLIAFHLIGERDLIPFRAGMSNYVRGYPAACCRVEPEKRI